MRRKPLRPGAVVWLWCAGVPARGRLVSRAVASPASGWWPRLAWWRVQAGSGAFFAHRRDLFLCREDCANRL